MDLPKRKRNRLKEYDYASSGAYFITICTKDKKHILSKIVSNNTVGNVIGWLKYNITKIINQQNKTEGVNIFQRSFHDHIIRNKNDYEMIWHYIDTNSQNWEKDCFYE